jgi:Ca-activated chloride channel homolog
MSSEPLRIAADFDCTLVRERGESVRYLCVEVTAPSIEVSAGEPRPPLNLALVVDSSGSMGGAPMAAAKQAVKGVVEGLNGDDSLTVVSFAEDVIVHVDPVCPSAENTAQILKAVDRIVTRGMTDLSSGWLTGAEYVARVMRRETKYHNHVVLLSDGHANKGIVEPDKLERHADELRKRHVFTSTVGIGDGYSSTQLQALAEFGGGRMHHAEQPDEIIEVVLGELSELSRCLFDNVEVTLSFPQGVKVQNVSRFPTYFQENLLKTHVGSLGPGQLKRIIFRVTAPEGLLGDSLQFVSTASAVNSKEQTTLSGERALAVLTYAPEYKASTQVRDIEVALKSAQVWQASVVRHAVDINRAGNHTALERYLDHEILYLARYCEALPDSRSLLDELVKLRDAAEFDWDERTRKDIQVTTYQSIHGYRDYRTSQRLHWSANFQDESLDRKRSMSQRAWGEPGESDEGSAT